MELPKNLTELTAHHLASSFLMDVVQKRQPQLQSAEIEIAYDRLYRICLNYQQGLIPYLQELHGNVSTSKCS
jgi:hypothetical protein